MGAQSPMPPGGSRMLAISSNWRTTSLGWIVLAGVPSDGKPKPFRANSSSVFAFVTDVSTTSPPLRSVGLPLLRRDFCPDGKKSLTATSVPERHAVISQVKQEQPQMSIRHLCETLSVNRRWYDT